MQTDRFSPPTAEVLDMSSGSAPDTTERPPRPISVWILQVVLAICVGLFLFGFSRMLLALLNHQLVVVSAGTVILALAWRIGVVAAVVVTMVWVHRGRGFARWLALAAIILIAALTLTRPDTTEYANEAERAGGRLGFYVIFPALFLWWAYAAAFSAKAKAYFSRGRAAA